MKVATRPSMKRFISIATKRQEATKRFENGEQNFKEMDQLNSQFWAWVHKVTDYYGITAVRKAETEAGILESNRAWS